MKKRDKYLTLLSLYIAQSIPMSFFSTVLPVIMRMENISLSTIAYVQLIKLPWIFKFLWAPMIDNRASGIRHYTKWIINTELLYALTLVGLSFIQFESHMPVVMALIVIAILFSATQDIASDAFAIKILDRKERGLGNSMQSSGSFMGTLFGSGVLLMLYPIIGWRYIVLLLGGIVLIALIPVIINTRDASKFVKIEPKRASPKDILSFFTQPSAWKRIIILAFYYSGLIGILAMLKPLLVDYDYKPENIGFIFGIYGTSIGAASAFLAGFILKKLPRKTVLLIFSFLNLLVAPLFLALIQQSFGTFEVYLGMGFIWCCYGLSSVAIYTISMDFAREGREGTDFTIQIVVTHLSGIIMAMIAGNVAELFGYSNLFLVEIFFAVTALLCVQFLFEPRKEDEVILVKENQ
jgi:predicted MFS family arabinose efflux permease